MAKKVEYFDPKTDKFPYTEITDHHYLKVKKDNGMVFDAHYPYIDNSAKAKFLNFWVRVLLVLIVFPLCYIALGLRVKGKHNLKRYKNVIKEGVLSCCNHVHLWDYLMIMCAIKPKRPKVLVWDKNIRGENGALMRRVGGIPIPLDNQAGTLACFNAIDKYLKSGGWLHIYPEGSMWEYYAPIRPFKRGISYFAIMNKKPVIPLAFSYRKPGWIRRKLFHQIALFTLNIGKPIYPNEELMGKERENDLTTRLHEAVIALAGRDVNNKLYGDIFNNDKRVDYYTTEYGKGYK